MLVPVCCSNDYDAYAKAQLDIWANLKLVWTKLKLEAGPALLEIQVDPDQFKIGADFKLGLHTYMYCYFKFLFK